MKEWMNENVYDPYHMMMVNGKQTENTEQSRTKT